MILKEGKVVHVEVESTFTLQYPPYSEKDADFLMFPSTADMLVPSSKSEWSLRIFSDNNGNDLWDPEIVAIFTTKFKKIVASLVEQELIVSDEDRYCK